MRKGVEATAAILARAALRHSRAPASLPLMTSYPSSFLTHDYETKQQQRRFPLSCSSYSCIPF